MNIDGFVNSLVKAGTVCVDDNFTQKAKPSLIGCLDVGLVVSLFSNKLLSGPDIMRESEWTRLYDPSQMTGCIRQRCMCLQL